MGEKDITARALAEHPDVFADIVNGSVFVLTGQWPSPLVRPEDLVDVPARGVSVSRGKVRGLALTGDRGLIENLPNIQQGGKPVTVRNIFGEVRRQGRAEGIQIGKAEGIQIGEARGGLKMLVSLVSDGLLSLAAAAKKAGMTEDEFKNRMGEQARPGEA